MSKSGRSSQAFMWFSAILLATGLAGCGSGDGGPSTFGNRTTTQAGQGTGVGGNGRGPAPVSLGTSGNFTVLAQSAVTSVPTSAITGDVGLSPAAGSAYVLTCPEVVGVIYSESAGGPACEVVNATLLGTAIGDKGAAYTDANARAPDYTELGGGNLGGMNLAPATYKFGTGVLIPTNLTLTGGPNDVWIFQIAQGLTVSPGVQIILAGGALPQNIFWATFAAAALDTTSKFKGTILSQTNIAMQTGATINGKLWAGTGVTLNQNTVGP